MFFVSHPPRVFVASNINTVTRDRDLPRRVMLKVEGLIVGRRRKAGKVEIGQPRRIVKRVIRVNTIAPGQLHPLAEIVILIFGDNAGPDAAPVSRTAVTAPVQS